MENLKRSINLKKLLILFTVIASAVSFSSCKDDKDEPDSGSSALVGNWYFTEDGDIDYDDTFSFKSNGSVTYTIGDELVTGKFSFDEKAQIITFFWEDEDWETERMECYFINKDKIYIDWYGIYIKK